MVYMIDLYKFTIVVAGTLYRIDTYTIEEAGAETKDGIRIIFHGHESNTEFFHYKLCCDSTGTG